MKKVSFIFLFALGFLFAAAPENLCAQTRKKRNAKRKKPVAVKSAPIQKPPPPLQCTSQNTGGAFKQKRKKADRG
jgi:hypothetical protein